MKKLMLVFAVGFALASCGGASSDNDSVKDSLVNTVEQHTDSLQQKVQDMADSTKNVLEQKSDSVKEEIKNTADSTK